MKKILFIAACLTFMWACKPDDAIKGLDNFRLELNSDIFKYKIYVEVRDESRNPIINAEIKLLGDDAEHLFNEFGNRKFTTDHNGNITLALHPSHEPSSSRSISFDIMVDDEGYEKGVLPVDVHHEQFFQQKNMAVFSLSGLEQLGIEITDLPSANGAISGGLVINKTEGSYKVVNNAALDSVYYDDKDYTILIEDGTRFYYFIETYKTVERTVSRVKRVETFTETFSLDSALVNGVWVYAEIKEKTSNGVAFDTVWTTYKNRVLVERKKVDYTGNKIRVISSSSSKSPQPYVQVYWENDYLLRAMSSTGKVEQCNFTQFTKIAKAIQPQFRGEIEDGSEVNLYPIDRANLIYSYVIDESKTNPITGQAFKAGDSIETGMRPNTNEFVSTRTVINATPNGQLRVQAPQAQFGYYDFYPYENIVDITLIADKPDLEVIPDPENLYADFYCYINLQGNRQVLMSDYAYGDNLWFFKNDINIKRRYYSQFPLPEAELRFRSSYWGNKWENAFTGAGNTGTHNLFPENWMNAASFKPQSTYEVAVVCAANDSVVLHPTVSAQSAIGGHPVRVKLKNGKWSTRGVDIGETMSLNIQYDSWSLDTSFILDQLHNTIIYYDQTNLDMCDM